MVTYICVMFIIFTIICVWTSLESDSVGIAMLGILFGVLSGVTYAIAVDEKNSQNSPTAIEVYQGKTTLQITYKDSIAVDSIVVYK